MAALVLCVGLVTSACGARFKDDTTLAQTTATTAGLTTDETLATGETVVTGGVTPSGGGNGTTNTTAGSGTQQSSTVEPGSPLGTTANSIKIGYLLPITGAAPIPSNFDKGANVYWNYVNSKGGINGRKVSVVIKDTQSSASVGKQEAQKLIEDDKVFAVVVLDRLENQKAIGAYLDSRKMPNIEIQTPTNLDANQSWTFGVTIDHAVQGALIADYFVKVLKTTKAAVVHENTSELVPGKNAFIARMKQLGGTVSYAKAIEANENDFSGVALELSRSGATATWLYMAPTAAAKLANQAAINGYHPTWFANSISWAFNLTFAVAPTALKGARAFSPWLPLSDGRTQTFQNAYREQTNQNPDDLGIVGWGVGEIVGEALRRTPNPIGQNAFRNAMQNLDFSPQIWSPVKFGANVRIGSQKVAVLKEDGGKWVLDRDFTSAF